MNTQQVAKSARSACKHGITCYRYVIFKSALLDISPRLTIITTEQIQYIALNNLILAMMIIACQLTLMLRVQPKPVHLEEIVIDEIQNIFGSTVIHL